MTNPDSLTPEERLETYLPNINSVTAECIDALRDMITSLDADYNLLVAATARLDREVTQLDTELVAVKNVVVAWTTEV